MSKFFVFNIYIPKRSVTYVTFGLKSRVCEDFSKCYKYPFVTLQKLPVNPHKINICNTCNTLILGYI